MVVGETHHFRKPPHIYYIYIYTPHIQHAACSLFSLEVLRVTREANTKALRRASPGATPGVSGESLVEYGGGLNTHDWKFSGRKLGAKWPRNFEENSFQIGGLKATKVVFFFFCELCFLLM